MTAEHCWQTYPLQSSHEQFELHEHRNESARTKHTPIMANTSDVVVATDNGVNGKDGLKTPQSARTRIKARTNRFTK